MADQLQLNENDKVYMFMLAGGLGARIIQTSFIRSLIKKRNLEGNNYPILVVDNSMIGHMVSEALKEQNVHGIQVPESHSGWPKTQPPTLLPNGLWEHPMFIDQWRENFKAFDVGQGSLHNLLSNNWNRAYSIEYGFSLTKQIHLHKHKKDKKSFIGHLYGKTCGLEYDDGVPMLKMIQQSNELQNYIDSQTKPIVLLHLGTDLNPHDFESPIIYRYFKVWSLQRWAELVDQLKDRYSFVQVYANTFNPEIPNVKAIKVDNLNPVLQLLNSPKCKFFMSTDNYLPHLASSVKKAGIVLWGSVSPNVWGWDKHYHGVPHTHVWNTHSCDQIACWRPSMFDTDQNGKVWVCPKDYNCMKSITTKQVIREIDKLEESLSDSPNLSNNISI